MEVPPEWIINQVVASYINDCLLILYDYTIYVSTTTNTVKFWLVFTVTLILDFYHYDLIVNILISRFSTHYSQF